MLSPYGYWRSTLLVAACAALLLVLVLGCSSKDSSGPTNPPQPTTSDTLTVGPLGDTLISSSGKVVLIFPPGALDHDTLITVSASSSNPASPGAVSGSFFTFQPEGISFQTPVFLKINYDSANVPQHVPEASLKICKLITGQWQPVGGYAPVADSNYVRGYINGFSTYGIVGQPIEGLEYSGTYFLTTAADTAGIYAYTKITGDLRIDGSAGDSINLPNLKWVGGNFLVSAGGASSLKTIKCPELTYVGMQIRIQSAWGLQRLELPKLVSSATINIQDTKSLKNFDGLSGMRTLIPYGLIKTSILLVSNDSLENLDGLGGIGGRIGGITINRNRALASVAGLGGISVIDNSLEILNCAQLTTLAGLSVTSIGLNFTLMADTRLASLTGLEHLGRVGGTLSISDCYALTSLEGLTTLNWVGGKFGLVMNTSLRTTAGIGPFPSTGGTFEIDECDNLSDLSGFSMLTTVNGPFRITNSDSITSFDGFGALNHIGGEMKVYNLYNLDNMDGLTNLKHVWDGILIDHNVHLRSIAGLWNLLPDPSTGYVSPYITITNNGQAGAPPTGLGDGKAWEMINKVGGTGMFPDSSILIEYN